MWIYEKKLQYPVNIKKPNPRLAGIIISQLGGPDGEMGAATRYLHQRYTMPSGECIGILTDIGTEELAHTEMISALLYQLTKNLTPDEIRAGGFDKYFVDHTLGIYPASATGEPFTAHTTNPVPFILVNADPSFTLREGGALCDIIPTMIEMMGMEQPKEMTGKSLIVRK